MVDMQHKHRDLVVPGEQIAKGRFRAGENVIRLDDSYYSTVLGTVEVRERGEIAVRALKGPYMPVRGDRVIGRVVDVSLGSWTIDIRAPYEASLPLSHFPRRINPVFEDIRNVMNVGDFVYCEIAEFDRFHSPVLDARREREYGVVTQGMLIAVEPKRVPRIIGKRGSMLQLLSKELDSKITVAQNGYVWVVSKSEAAYRLAVEAIRKIEEEAHLQGLTTRMEEYFRKVTLKTQGANQVGGSAETSGSGVEKLE